MVDETKKVGNPPDVLLESPQPGTPPATPPPDPFAGKTLEELAAILKEKEKMIGRQAQELGDLRTKTSELDNRLAFQSQFGVQQREPNPLETPFGVVREPEPDAVPPDFYDNPRKYVIQWQEERERKRVEEMQKRDIEIKFNIYRAKPVIEQAKKESPHLFNGISEPELETILYNGLANNLVSPYSLGDTRTYKQAAMWLQGEKSGYRWNPHEPQGSPVPPTATESYVGHQEPVESAGETPLVMDDLTRELVAHRPAGMSERDFLAKVREEQKRR